MSGLNRNDCPESTVYAVISEIVDKEDGDFEFLAQASVNLVLLGIDLNENELVSLGIKKIEDKVLGKRINEVPEIRLLTTIALGYAFLKKFISALKTLSKLRGQDFTVEVLGFAGSLASMAERNEEAAVLFYLAFKQRESPLTWPLKALIGLDPTLAGPINSLFGEGKIPDLIDINDGNKITNLILNSHLEWFEHISNITDFLSKLGQEKKKTNEIEGT